MKTKKGFTLVELLAVIAILAILVIIAIPNVLRIYNSSKKNSFVTEVQTILKQTSTNYVQDIMSDGYSEKYIYTNVDDYRDENTSAIIETNLLNIETNKNYIIVLDSNGEINEVKIWDNSFCYSNKGNVKYINVNVNDINEDICEYNHGTPHKLTINYIYLDGSTAYDTYSKDVIEGKKFDVESPTINEYYPDKTKISGKMGTSDISFTVTYRKGEACQFIGTLDVNSLYVEGIYSYLYEKDGWKVYLTDKNSTNAITQAPCSSVNGKPIISMENAFSRSKATSIDLSNFDTSNVVNMSNMFTASEASVIKGLEHLNTSNVTNMRGMFWASKATTISGLQGLNTSKVTDMSWMFSYTNVDTLNLNNFDTSNVTDMDSMFYESKVSTLKIDNFDTKNVTGMGCMFSYTNITSLNLSSFDTSNVTDMRTMFAYAQVEELDLSNFITNKVTVMESMFEGSIISVLDLSSFDMSNVTSNEFMFMNSSISKAYGRSTADIDILNATRDKPSELVFILKED
ncbi:MAG: BspA family leucine-rich repeat surface protein [Bacilli bacterium]